MGRKLDIHYQKEGGATQYHMVTDMHGDIKGGHDVPLPRPLPWILADSMTFIHLSVYTLQLLSCTIYPSPQRDMLFMEICSLPKIRIIF